MCTTTIHQTWPRLEQDGHTYPTPTIAWICPAVYPMLVLTGAEEKMLVCARVDVWRCVSDKKLNIYIYILYLKHGILTRNVYVEGICYERAEPAHKVTPLLFGHICVGWVYKIKWKEIFYFVTYRTHKLNTTCHMYDTYMTHAPTTTTLFIEHDTAHTYTCHKSKPNGHSPHILFCRGRTYVVVVAQFMHCWYAWENWLHNIESWF